MVELNLVVSTDDVQDASANDQLLVNKTNQALQGVIFPVGGDVFTVAYSPQIPQTQSLSNVQLPAILFIDPNNGQIIGAIPNAYQLSVAQLKDIILKYINVVYDEASNTYVDSNGELIPYTPDGLNVIPGLGLFNFSFNLPPLVWLALAAISGYKAYSSKKKLIQGAGAAGAIISLNQYLKSKQNG